MQDSTRLDSTQLTASSIHDSVTENENAWIERIESCRLPCLDLNQEPIPNWTVLVNLVDLGTADAANLFFQIVKQLRGSEEQDRLEISINNHSATKVVSFQSIAQVEEETWQKVANRAKLSKLAGLKEWGVKYGRFLGKYQFQEEEKHLSDTCMVVFGTELIVVSGATQETNVVFKLFTERAAFLRKLAKRKIIMSIHGAERFVIGVRAVYTDCMEWLYEYGHLDIEIKLNQTVKWRKGDIEFNHLLVMDCGNKNDLSDVISHKNIAGKDALMVRSIAIQIAKCLQFLNEECNVMHGDVKARNFVSRGEGVGYAAIDLDKAASTDENGEEAGQKQTSSGYLPPEQAAVEYHLREKEQGASEDFASEGPAKIKASHKYDMWCFGAHLYNLCTGHQLFVMNEREEVSSLDELKKIVNWSDEDCVKKVDYNVWDDNDWNPMKPLLKKLLKRDPEERYHRWADIIEKLEDGDTYNGMQVIGNKVQVLDNGVQVWATKAVQVNQKNQAMFSYMKA